MLVVAAGRRSARRTGAGRTRTSGAAGTRRTGVAEALLASGTALGRARGHRGARRGAGAAVEPGQRAETLLLPGRLDREAVAALGIGRHHLDLHFEADLQVVRD